MTSAALGAGAAPLWRRMAHAWAAPASSWRVEWSAGVTEGRLLALAMGAAGWTTLGRVAAEAAQPAAAFGDERPAWFTAQIFVGLSFLPLSLYLVAALAGLAARAAGGMDERHWSRARLAFFWSGFAAGPVGAVIATLAAAAGATAFGAMAAGVIWLALWAPMLAAAHGFRVAPVIAAFATLIGAVFLATSTV